MNRKNVAFFLVLSVLAAYAPVRPAQAGDTPETKQESNAELAQELSNPLADLMSIPFQMNYDGDIGPQDDGWKLQTNIQPVIPFHLTKEWNLISRTILPVFPRKISFPGRGPSSAWVTPASVCSFPRRNPHPAA
jgi:hypothetical protein